MTLTIAMNLFSRFANVVNVLGSRLINLRNTIATNTIIDDLFTALSSIITKVIGLFTALWEGVVAVFWDSTNGLTAMGFLILIGLGFALFYGAFRLVRNLVKMRG